MEILYLTTTKTASDSFSDGILDSIQLDDHIRNYTEREIIDQKLLHVPIVINVTLLPCPPGLTLQQIPAPHCHCNSILVANNIKCSSSVEGSVFRWDKLLWIGYNYGEASADITISRCPIDNCKMEEKVIS